MNCPHCDQEIPNKSEFCIFCGEKIVQKKRPKAIITLSILLAISLAMAGGELIYILVKVPSMAKSIQTYENALSDYKNIVSTKNARIADLEDKESFVKQHVAIAIDGTWPRLYHVYGCPNINYDLSAYIYNTEAVEGKGYQPCPYCH